MYALACRCAYVNLNGQAFLETVVPGIETAMAGRLKQFMLMQPAQTLMLLSGNQNLSPEQVEAIKGQGSNSTVSYAKEVCSGCTGRTCYMAEALVQAQGCAPCSHDCRGR